MYGSTMGNLTVSKVKGGNSSVLYTKNGSQSKDWFDVLVDIPADSSYQVNHPREFLFSTLEDALYFVGCSVL